MQNLLLYLLMIVHQYLNNIYLLDDDQLFQLHFYNSIIVKFLIYYDQIGLNYDHQFKFHL